MLQTTLQSRAGTSTAVTHGIRVSVRPAFLAQQSRAEMSNFMWAYRVRLTNEGEVPVKLLTRHWLIIDADGVRKEVEGEGVVGQQPELEPGESYEYTSHVPLETTWGTMEGSYVFVDANGNNLRVAVPRFMLVPKPAARSEQAEKA